MWWSRRHLVLGALAIALPGCGFTPVYAPGNSGTVLDNAVTLVTPQTDDGFNLRQRLQERLGASDAPRFTLTVSITTRTSRVAVTREQDTRRFNILGQARYTLTDAATGKTVVSGEVDSFTSYAATGTTVATLAAERDAYRRLMTILADGIVDRLYITLPDSVQ